MAKTRNFKLSPRWKAVIGFFGALAVILGLFLGVARYESKAREDDAAAAQEATKQLQAQCYTPTTILPYTTGDSEVDSAFAWILQNPDASGVSADEAQKYVKENSYKIGDFKKSEAFQAAQAAEATQDTNNVYYLNINAAGTISAKTAPDERVYSYVELPREDAVTDAAISLKFVGSDGKTSYSTQVVVPLSADETSTDPLQIPVLSWEEGVTGSSYQLSEASPLCEITP